MGGDTAARSNRALRKPYEERGARAKRGFATTGDELYDLIPEFLREVEEGRDRADGGHAYTRQELRELRAALAHINSELGTMRMRDVRAWHMDALLERLRSAGISARRVRSIVEAFRALYAYAQRRGLIETSPLGMLLLGDEPRTERKVGETRTPTDAMLALGGQAVTWTTRIIVITFIAIVIALGYELRVTDAIPFP